MSKKFFARIAPICNSQAVLSCVPPHSHCKMLKEKKRVCPADILRCFPLPPPALLLHQKYRKVLLLPLFQPLLPPPPSPSPRTSLFPAAVPLAAVQQQSVARFSRSTVAFQTCPRRGCVTFRTSRQSETCIYRYRYICYTPATKAAERTQAAIVRLQCSCVQTSRVGWP